MHFKQGDRVTVRIPEFTGTVNFNYDHDDYVDVVPDDRSDETAIEYIPVEYVTAIEPASWPPQVGDIWRTSDGTEWFARRSAANPACVVLCNPDQKHGNYYSKTAAIAASFEKFKELRPVLVRRRDS